MRTFFRFFLGLLLPLFCGMASATEPSLLPTVDLTIGEYTLKAEVARTADQRDKGLMFREKLAPDTGMVFLYHAPAHVCMWMKNTLLPLSVAFITQDGRITNIADMTPHSEESHCATERVHYALEMEQGWFSQRNIKAGSRIQGLPQSIFLNTL